MVCSHWGSIFGPTYREAFDTKLGQTRLGPPAGIVLEVKSDCKMEN